MTLVFLAAASRLWPHPPNFTAVPAMALFGGSLFGRRWLAFAIPLLAMASSDLVLGVFVYGTRVLPGIVPVYACIATAVLIGQRLPRSGMGVVLGAAAATAVFFTVTNFVVWAGQELYPHTLGGLGLCYLAALPFAANMLASSLLYGAGLFGLWALAERRYPALAVHT
jgi:hypothetical protein